MHIEQPESFRTWLTSVLGPLCDADPVALARYVYALVRKDKPIEELRDTMVDQLDVFLQKETKSFVALLFKTIENKEYLTVKKDVVSKDEKKEEPSSSIEAPTIEPVPEKELDEPITSSEEKQITQIQSCVVSESTVKDEIANKGEKKDDKKKEVERDERFRLNRSKLKAVPGYQPRSRSRSWERIRRSRSRDRLEPREPRDRERDRERERMRDRGRPYRNKSPPRRFERRRSFSSKSPSPGRYRLGSRSKSRSPKYSRRFRNRSHTHSRSRSRSRSRESSFERKKSPHVGDNSMKDGGDRIPSGPLIPGSNGRRCRDFDIRGFCLRGELCPFDHGKDPVVVNDLGLPPPMAYGANPPAPVVMQGGPPMPGPPILPPIGPPPHIFHGPPPMMIRPPPNMEYSPDAPSLNPNMSWGRPLFHHPHHPRGGGRMMHGMGMHPNQRELINVPTDSHGPYHGDGHHHDGKRGYMLPQGNCCLDIKKIPPCLNNITHLNNHFAKFGKIINIQVNYNNDPEAAMITFSSPAEANAAFKSTEAVLNNRFIKVFWHMDPKDGPRGNSNVKDRLGLPAVPGNQDQSAGNAAANKQAGGADPFKRVTEDGKARALDALKKSQEILEKNHIIRKKTEETRKEAIVLSTELRKRSQNLLDKHIDEQKELLKKLESGALEKKQREALKEAIKHLQGSIEKLRTELLQSSKDIKKPPAKKSREQIQKEILDTEMDILKTQQEGGDVVQMQKTLGQLKFELKRLQQKSIASSPKSPTYHPYPSPLHKVIRSRPNSKVNNRPVIDHRPTKLLVSGYENDDKESVLSHFREFGEIVDYFSDDSTPSIVLNYKSRDEAEAAMNKGKNFQDRLLAVTWFTSPQLTSRRRNSSASGPTYHMHAGRQVILSGSEPDLESENLPDNEDSEDLGLETNEDFLLQDDDEDGDDEERSWRR